MCLQRGLESHVLFRLFYFRDCTLCPRWGMAVHGVPTNLTRKSGVFSFANLCSKKCYTILHSCRAYCYGVLLLKTVDTIGNCQRAVFSLGIYQHMHKITNKDQLRDNYVRKNTLVKRSCVLSDA